ncbi:hypothetical protein ABXT06_17935 [Flavobacterium sp. UW10123]|uniref:hypothetical protein n=1 Tax=Flavobacterium sp. UW10123 TaxID=3230800 RepID=UPI00339AE157
MIIKNHTIELNDTSASEMARFRQIMLNIWRQQIEDDRNAAEMEKFVKQNDKTYTKTFYADESNKFDQTTLIDSKQYSGNFYSKNGLYLGNNGELNNIVYVVENDGYKIYDTGNKTAETKMDISKLINFTEKTGLSHSQMLDRANWIYAEGGYKIPEFYAYTIENAYNDKSIGKKNENRVYFYLMQDASGRLEKDKYLSGGYSNQTGKRFWNARGTTLMDEDMRNTIAAVIKSKLYPEKDPTGGTNSWLGYKNGEHEGEYYIKSLDSRHFFQKREYGKSLKKTNTEKKYKTIE